MTNGGRPWRNTGHNDAQAKMIRELRSLGYRVELVPVPSGSLA